VSAPEALTVGGAGYRFDRWSDGGARSHPFVVPAADQTSTAYYLGPGVMSSARGQETPAGAR
jgi:hypothetical protein